MSGDKVMTLEQVSTALRSLDLNHMADAIGAEIKARGKAVAAIGKYPGGSVRLDLLVPPDSAPSEGALLYAAPHAPKIEVTDAMVERAFHAAMGVGGESRPWLSREIIRTAIEDALKETP